MPCALACPVPTLLPAPPAGQYCVDCIADACLAARRDFDPRALAHVLWNMSRLGYVDELFYQAFVPGEEPWHVLGWWGNPHQTREAV